MKAENNIPSERTPQEPPLIRPVITANRPRWSVMIPVYNGSAFLSEAVNSVLTQAYPENQMQITVVDDCSDDTDVESLVERLSNGRIDYYRQPQNVGSLRNFETCLNLARGEYVHLLHGDDFVHPGFYHALDNLFKNFPAAGAAFCRYQYVDEHGNVVLFPEAEADHECVLENWLLRLAERQRVQYVAIAVKREVYETLGGFYGVHYGEDWEMWARIATKYPFAYTPQLLASYRQHADSISGKSFGSAQNLKDLKYVMNKISQYLPVEEKDKALSRAKKFYAHYALRTAHQLWRKFRNRKGAWAQMRAGWSFHRDFRLFYDSVKMVGRMILNI